MEVIEFEGLLEKFETSLWAFHIKVPADIVEHLKVQDKKRFMCRLNRGESFHSSMMPAGDNIFFIKVNKELRTKHKLKVGSQVFVSISNDNSQYGMTLPQEMAALFMQDPEGDLYFQKLTPGKQRSLLYLVSKIKDSDKRIEKSMIILEHLKEHKGSLDFKILHHDFKTKKGLF